MWEIGSVLLSILGTWICVCIAVVVVWVHVPEAVVYYVFVLSVQCELFLKIHVACVAWEF